MKKLLLLFALLSPTVSAQPTGDVVCLALNMYHEARGEHMLGKLAVAQVTLNRVGLRQNWQTICDVVYYPLQFSWTVTPNKVLDLNTWVDMVLLSHAIIKRGYALKYFTATHYHNHTVQPQWKLKKVKTIGNHTFYH